VYNHYHNSVAHNHYHNSVAYNHYHNSAAYNHYHNSAPYTYIFIRLNITVFTCISVTQNGAHGDQLTWTPTQLKHSCINQATPQPLFGTHTCSQEVFGLVKAVLSVIYERFRWRFVAAGLFSSRPKFVPASLRVGFVIQNTALSDVSFREQFMLPIIIPQNAPYNLIRYPEEGHWAHLGLQFQINRSSPQHEITK